MPKQPKETRDTRKVMARLASEGWIMRAGKGDHVNFFKPGTPALITIDTGPKEVDANIYRKIKRIAGWK
ncbi:type II toxin-antitoxin system HicA family toxin [uncultured Adlercreutzia sp.]|uniref:type II toxin-antitoxin system HicA family toxin n=1 Tax=uncultured Adlercreutzia sp. TaxID=875803 RepID=UPI00345D2C6C